MNSVRRLVAAAAAALALAGSPAAAQQLTPEQTVLVWCSALLWEESTWWQREDVIVAYEQLSTELAFGAAVLLGQGGFTEPEVDMILNTFDGRAVELAANDTEAFVNAVIECEELFGIEVWSGQLEALATDVGDQLWCSAVLATGARLWLDMGLEAAAVEYERLAMQLEEAAYVESERLGHDPRAFSRGLHHYYYRSWELADELDAFADTLSACENRFAQ
jgi:hypothetical protein